MGRIASSVFLARSGTATYIEDVFSTYLYTGNGSTQTITNGVDLSGKGGLVWTKDRNNGLNHALYDTARGATSELATNTSSAASTESGFSFLSSGYSFGARATLNFNTGLYASWTFRKQPKFFDVVTYTGNGVAGRTVAHNLGSVPGCIIVKRTDNSGNWFVYHRGLTSALYYMLLETPDGEMASSSVWNSTDPTSTVFTVGSTPNQNGATYVAYLFAHNAGGFGLNGTDSVISCGSYTNNDPFVDLGWEPQFIITKNATRDGTDWTWAGRWVIEDTMRGMTTDGQSGNILSANEATAEVGACFARPRATGFQAWGGATNVRGPNSDKIIYIAIRRGPMRTPTSGTSVFSPLTFTGSTNTLRTTGFPVDLQVLENRGGTFGAIWADRLRGVPSVQTSAARPVLRSSVTNAEDSASYSATNNFSNTGFADPAYLNGISGVYWSFRRAPGFFDVVCYTGTGANLTVSHGLGVAPELMITKKRSEATNSSFWWVYHKDFVQPYYALLNSNAAGTATGTALYASVGATAYTAQQEISQSSQTYVTYLFASLPGVSKVGSYTGTGTTLQVNCGFTAGARFVLIKRTDSTGDWYVWDSARGIVAGNDPHLSLNSTAAEVTSNDSVDPDNSGFIVNQVAATNINVSSATYIFLAIA